MRWRASALFRQSSTSWIGDPALAPQTLRRRALIGGAGAALLASPALGQGFPQRPIRFICPFPAGGIVDILMRAFNEELGTELGQPVVIDPRPGAGGLIGSQQLVAAPADGHTLMMATQAHLVAPILTPSSFHPVEAVQGVALAAHSVSLVVVPAALPVRNMAELVALAKRDPGRLNYLRPGSGSFGHMTMEVLKRAAGIEVTAVDYRGLPPGIIDLIAERIHIAFLSTGLTMTHIREGRLRAIATIGPARAPELPDLPTMTEQGLADANLDSYYAIIAPRGVPAPVVDRINQAFGAVVARPEVRRKLAAAGGVPARQIAPAEVQAMLARDYARYVALIRDANIQAN
jgi:tripartite-type tricarboxylate transporter receptor subunit TctC